VPTLRLLLLPETAVPEADDWLAPEERERLQGFRVPKRRAEWRLGRYAAKRLLAGTLPHPVPLHSIVVRPADDGAPVPLLDGLPMERVLSISHGGGFALCATAPAGVLLGCDIESIATRSDAFVQDYFTPAEVIRIRAAPEGERPLLTNLLWSGKESTLKALREGLRLDTRSVEVEVPAFGSARTWAPVAARHRGGEFQGWWRRSGEQVLTVISRPGSPHPPEIAAVPGPG
jgi:4'-phosphopantetheinyl transferase